MLWQLLWLEGHLWWRMLETTEQYFVVVEKHAVEISRDPKPICLVERKRIEASGGHIDDGYLNGQLNVARALVDRHMEGLKGRDGVPLGAEPELMKISLTEDDEFLIISCDGLWDVFMSQNAVDFARKRLQKHNDPIMCSKDLVDEALKRESSYNLAVVVVCFHQPPPPPNLVVPRGRVHQNISAEGLKELQSFFGSLQIRDRGEGFLIHFSYQYCKTCGIKISFWIFEVIFWFAYY